MKLLVFTKQVPDVAEIRFDADRKTIVREGIKNIMNAYDRRAISEAIRCRNEIGGEVTVATMGPPQAREALLEALLMGADCAIHIQDKRLAGSDTLVTAQVLASAARKIGFDLIFCALKLELARWLGLESLDFFNDRLFDGLDLLPGFYYGIEVK